MSRVKDKNTEWSNIFDTGREFTLTTSRALDRILTYTDDSLGKAHLDLGCGTGQLTRELYHRGYTCTGVDIASSAITLARKATVHPGLSYFQTNLEDDFSGIDILSKNKYSLITTKLVFAFIKNKKAFLRNVVKLIADGGVFVIITPDIKTTPEEKRDIAVDCGETLALLSEVFASVEVFELDTLTYFICRQPVGAPKP